LAGSSFAAHGPDHDGNGNVTESFRIIDSTDVPNIELELFYDEILAASFDSAELVERPELLAALADPESATRAAIAFDQTGLTVGGIVGDWFATCRVMLISYLAARPGLRGRGIGKRLLAQVLPAWTTQFGAVLVVAEVEDPRFYRDDEYHGNPEARLRLYASLGAKILDIPYFQPALSAQQPRVRNLFLMAFGVDQSVRTDENGVDAAVVRCFIEQYLADTEGVVDDEEVRAVRGALAAKAGVALLDPAVYLRNT
jgi:GNAT superfamily N-acetyltransferase